MSLTPIAADRPMHRLARAVGSEAAGVVQSRMERPLPMFMPACDAPLLVPYCRLTTDCPALSCSSLKSRTFFSLLRGQ